MRGRVGLGVIVMLLTAACNPFARPVPTEIPFVSPPPRVQPSLPPIADAPAQAALPSHPKWLAPVPIPQEVPEPISEQGSREPWRWARPADKPVSKRIGPFEISTYNPVTITGLENNTHIYFTARNTSSRPARIASFFSAKDFSSAAVSSLKRPGDWIVLHGIGFDAFEFDPFDMLARTVGPGKRFTFEYSVGKTVARGGRAESDVPIYFQLTDGGPRTAITVHMIGTSFGDALAQIPANAALAGRVLDASGRPIGGAEVTLGLWNDENYIPTSTAADGTYELDVPSQGELKSIVGNRPLPHRSLGYFVTVDAPGYELGYAQDVRATAGATTTLDFTLPAAPRPSYRKVAEFKSDGRYAYWYMALAGPDRDRVVASQGQHLPRAPLNPPGHVVALRLSDGEQLWRFPTSDGCNNLDVSPDGTRIAIGCWDGYMYVLDYQGRLLWKWNMTNAPKYTGNSREPTDDNLSAGSPRYSPDGRWLAGDRGLGVLGPFFTLYDARAGRARLTAAARQGVSGRVVKFRWAPDSKSMYVLGNNDEVSRYDLGGRLLWTRWDGNPALWAEVDSAGNIYVAGKGASMLSYDPSGRLRFFRMLAATADEATHGMSPDGRFLVAPTFNGLLQAFDSDGEPYFQRWLPGAATDGAPEGPGHNALDVTPDGRYFLVGTRSSRLNLFDAMGSLLWSDQAVDRTDFQFPEKIIDYFPGANSVALTPDAHYLAAGYADSKILIFERQ